LYLAFIPNVRKQNYPSANKSIVELKGQLSGLRHPEKETVTKL